MQLPTCRFTIRAKRAKSSGLWVYPDRGTGLASGTRGFAGPSKYFPRKDGCFALTTPNISGTWWTSALTQAAVQTANYAASANQIVPVSTESGNFTVMLPNTLPRGRS
jgi:hypothetical protein